MDEMIDILDDLQKYVPTVQTVEQVVVPHHCEQMEVAKNQFFNIAVGMYTPIVYFIQVCVCVI